jgi:hypothetical protein
MNSFLVAMNMIKALKRDDLSGREENSLNPKKLSKSEIMIERISALIHFRKTEEGVRKLNTKNKRDCKQQYHVNIEVQQ